MMKLRNLLPGLLACAALVLTACGEDDNPPPKTWPDPIGSYSFDGEEYPIYYLAFSQDNSSEGGYCSFLFSPIDQSEGPVKLTTYFLFSIQNFFVGKGELNVNELYHNDSYVFAYEDPVHFYSQYRKLQGGTVGVDLSGDGTIRLRLKDLRLNDGKPFSCEFEGMPTATVEP